MSQPDPVNILSDDETETLEIPDSTPISFYSKRRRTLFHSKSTAAVFLIDDDPTPRKTSASTPETPMSLLHNSGPVVVRCSKIVSDPKPSGIAELIHLESDNESDSYGGAGNRKQDAVPCATSEVESYSKFDSRCSESQFSLGNKGNVSVTPMYGERSVDLTYPEYEIPQVHGHFEQELDELHPFSDVLRTECTSRGEVNEENDMGKLKGKQRKTKEDKLRMMEEKRLQKEREKLQKAALKAEALEMKKVQKEKQKWEKGKLALKSIVAKIDTKVVEIGSVGGSLLSRFSEKGIAYRITSNPIERSIVWMMNVPDEISQLPPSRVEIPYVLLVYEADEFCNLVMNQSLMGHVSRVQSRYPTHTVCYLTNKLQSYINKREQGQYKDPNKFSGWKRPPVEEVLSRLTTHFSKVHSRQCIDEAELAEHVVGLTCSLASCQFRKKLTPLSINANGSIVPKDCPDKILIKKNLWLKALVAIPKVQPRFAIAIWKKYPTMKSLLRVYMDPSKSD
ncbi:crossover junction endonuclease EME1-like isoform X2 [Apium graveolens]|uniref:crossover junction endonuclease EME1-like isoform X2 n=1 Tax=Apium graveolens TaxID=4045 RepID=UPI003D7B44D3